MATGRGYLSIPAFQDVTFDVLLTFNGSYVTVGEKIIFKNLLTLARALVNMMVKRGNSPARAVEITKPEQNV